MLLLFILSIILLLRESKNKYFILKDNAENSGNAHTSLELEEHNQHIQRKFSDDGVANEKSEQKGKRSTKQPWASKSKKLSKKDYLMEKVLSLFGDLSHITLTPSPPCNQP